MQDNASSVGAWAHSCPHSEEANVDGAWQEIALVSQRAAQFIALDEASGWPGLPDELHSATKTEASINKSAG
jgi:hypothetical protein